VLFSDVQEDNKKWSRRQIVSYLPSAVGYCWARKVSDCFFFRFYDATFDLFYHTVYGDWQFVCCCFEL